MIDSASIAGIAIAELEVNRKGLAQHLGWIVYGDGFFVLAPVSVPQQRLAEEGQGCEYTNSANFWVTLDSSRDSRTCKSPIICIHRINDNVEQSRFPAAL